MAVDSAGTGVADEVGCLAALSGLASGYTSPAAVAWSAMFATQGMPAAAALAAAGPALRLAARAWLVLAARTRVAWDAWGNPASPQRVVSGGHRLARGVALMLEVGSGLLAARAGLQVLISGVLACMTIFVLATWAITARLRQPSPATVPLRHSPMGRSRWRRTAVVAHVPWLVGLAAGLELARTELALVTSFAILMPLALVAWPIRDPDPGEGDGTQGPPHPEQFDFVGPIDREAADQLARELACVLRREAPTFDAAIGFVPASAWHDVHSVVGAHYRARTRRHPGQGRSVSFFCHVVPPGGGRRGRAWQVLYEPGGSPTLHAPGGVPSPWPDDAAHEGSAAQLASARRSAAGPSVPPEPAAQPSGELLEQAWQAAARLPWVSRPLKSDLRDVLVDHPEQPTSSVVVETVDVGRWDSAILVITDTHLILGTSLDGRALARAMGTLPVPVRSDGGDLWVMTLPLTLVASVEPVLASGVRVHLRDGREVTLNIPGLTTSQGLATLTQRRRDSGA